jgi:hypothetical protein
MLWSFLYICLLRMFELTASSRRDEVDKAPHHLEADAGEAEGGQRPAQATPTPASTRPGAVVGERGARTSRLLLRAWQPPGSQRLPNPGQPALATGASASQPASSPELGSDSPPDHSVAAACPNTASLSRGALRRSYPRQEPSAVVPHAGICAGGRPQGRSLPQSASTSLTMSQPEPGPQLISTSEATRSGLGPGIWTPTPLRRWAG